MRPLSGQPDKNGREILRLAESHSLSHKEIADLLGLPTPSGQGRSSATLTRWLTGRSKTPQWAPRLLRFELDAPDRCPHCGKTIRSQNND